MLSCWIRHQCKRIMAEIATTKPKYSGKREFVEASGDSVENDPKKPKIQTNQERRDEVLPFKKKKMALMLAYCGKNYQGMQINPGSNTIEKVLVEALVTSGVILKNHAFKMSQMSFQRAARTDKGVSAAGQVVSLKINVVNPLVKINAQLPKDIKVFSIKRATKSFDSKSACTGRSYQYIIPTYAFTEFTETMVPSTYRLPADKHTQVNHVIGHLKGTHNFHNFTSHKSFKDKSAIRYITEFKLSEPYVRNDMEFATFTIEGQSFMLHQIRKMIGLAIAIVQGLADISTIDRAWEEPKCDIPRAPGLGLLLDKCHFNYYNKKFAESHDKLDWEEIRDEVEEFKEKFIISTIVETEVKENSMMQWLKTLKYHTFDQTKRNDEVGAMMMLHHRAKTDKLHEIEERQKSKGASSEGKSESEEEAKSEDEEATQSDEETENKATEEEDCKDEPAEKEDSMQ